MLTHEALKKEKKKSVPEYAISYGMITNNFT